MSLILNIDTSTENASICLASGGRSLFQSFNDTQKEHSGWLHPAIKNGFAQSGKSVHELQAVGITAGPGSYTGLRIAMATAKGLCFALKIPLIAVNTLQAMATTIIDTDADYICPMIDARRMEAFMALYDKNLEPIISPCTIVLDENSFYTQLTDKKIHFIGNGKNKFEKIIDNKNAIFKDVIFNASDLALLTYKRFIESDFSPLATTHPIYLKDHYTLFIAKS